MFLVARKPVAAEVVSGASENLAILLLPAAQKEWTLTTKHSGLGQDEPGCSDTRIRNFETKTHQDHQKLHPQSFPAF